MTIYLDYFLDPKTKEMTFISVIDNNTKVEFLQNNLDEALDYLLARDRVVVFERPFMHIKRAFPLEDRIVDPDEDEKVEWFDLFRQLAVVTGKEISISGLAKGMIGRRKRFRLSTTQAKTLTKDVKKKINDRLLVIKQVYDALESGSLLRYYYKGSLHAQSVDTNELLYPLSN